jgi:beta-galactosidase
MDSGDAGRRACGDEGISFHVENRFDFIDLSKFSLAWTLLENRTERARGVRSLSAAAHKSEMVSIPVDLRGGQPGDIWSVALRCVTPDGRVNFERTIHLAQAQTAVAISQEVHDLALDQNETLVRVSHPAFVLEATRADGRVTIRDHEGRALATGPFVHVGRPFTMAEVLRAKNSPIWSEETEATRHGAVAGAERVGEDVRITLRASATREDAPDQTIGGEISLLVRRNGTIDVAYDFAPANAKGALLEAGVAFITPASELRWIGQGPYAAYPGKERLDEFGIHQLDRDALYFQGNRRDVTLAIVADRRGAGLALSGAPDVSVERAGDDVRVGINALVSGRGNKGVGPELVVDAGNVEKISGKFSFAPLGTRWPDALARLFGEPGERAKPLSHFYHSYDQ